MSDHVEGAARSGNPGLKSGIAPFIIGLAIGGVAAGGVIGTTMIPEAAIHDILARTITSTAAEAIVGKTILGKVITSEAIMDVISVASTIGKAAITGIVSGAFSSAAARAFAGGIPIHGAVAGAFVGGTAIHGVATRELVGGLAVCGATAGTFLVGIATHGVATGAFTSGIPILGAAAGGFIGGLAIHGATGGALVAGLAIGGAIVEAFIRGIAICGGPSGAFISTFSVVAAAAISGIGAGFNICRSPIIGTGDEIISGAVGGAFVSGLAFGGAVGGAFIEKIAIRSRTARTVVSRAAINRIAAGATMGTLAISGAAAGSIVPSVGASFGAILGGSIGFIAVCGSMVWTSGATMAVKSRPTEPSVKPPDPQPVPDLADPEPPKPDVGPELNEKWFHGQITDTEAESRCVNRYGKPRSDGAYLVRKVGSDYYLYVCYKQVPCKFKISNHKDQWKVDGNAYSSPSLKGLIEYHQKKPVRVRSNEWVKLRTPVPRS